MGLVVTEKATMADKGSPLLLAFMSSLDDVIKVLGGT